MRELADGFSDVSHKLSVGFKGTGNGSPKAKTWELKRPQYLARQPAAGRVLASWRVGQSVKEDPCRRIEVASRNLQVGRVVDIDKVAYAIKTECFAKLTRSKRRTGFQRPVIALGRIPSLKYLPTALYYYFRGVFY